MNLGIPKSIDEHGTVEVNIYTPSGNKHLGVLRVNAKTQVAQYTPMNNPERRD